MLYRKQATFTTSQSWTFPSTALPSVDYDVLGGGGAGGTVYAGGTQTSASGGGGGGGRKQGIATLVPGDTYSIIVGAGGVGSTVNPGTHGGESEVVGIVSVPGGRSGEPDLVGGKSSSSGNGAPAIPALRAYQNTDMYIAYTDSGAGGAAYITVAPNSSAGWGATGIGGECSGGGGGGLGPTGAGAGAGKGGAGAGDGGAGVAGAAATGIGCGGGGAGRSTGYTARGGGNGMRGEVRIIYWDTVP